MLASAGHPHLRKGVPLMSNKGRSVTLPVPEKAVASFKATMK